MPKPMPKQLLHCPDVVTVLERIGGKKVVKDVATSTLVNSRSQDSVSNSQLNE